ALAAEAYYKKIDATRPTYDALAARLQKDEHGRWRWRVAESRQAREQQLERERAGRGRGVLPLLEARAAAKKAHEIFDRHLEVLGTAKEKIEALLIEHPLALERERQDFRAGRNPTAFPDKIEAALKVERRRFETLSSDVDSLQGAARLADN